MSAQLASSHNDDNVVELNDSPGRRLRVTRQARNLTVERVASQLHLAPDLIAALERDDYDALPGSVFVIGYMRNYARVVGLDPEPLLDAYRATSPQATLAQPRTRSSSPRQAGSGHLLVRLLSVVIVVAAGGLAYSWWQSQYGDTSPTEAQPEESAAAVAIASPPARGDITAPRGKSMDPPNERLAPDSSTLQIPQVDPSTPAPLQAPALVSEPPEPTASEPEPTAAEDTSNAQADPGDDTAAAAPAPESAPPPGGQEAPPPTEGQITMSFSGPCWVDIRDSANKFKLFGEMGKGDRHVLGGTPPYSVILGNASAVTITIADAPFDLDGIARGNVARFTLDPAQVP